MVAIVGGHLFLVNGDLTKIAADAVLIPTDAYFQVEAEWHGLVTPADVAGLRWPSGVRCMPLNAAADDLGRVWIGNLGGVAETQVDWYLEGVRQFLKHTTSVAPRGPVRRVALPLVGTGAGGAAFKAGGLCLSLIKMLRDQAEELGIDIVLVLWGERPFAAAQRARRDLAERKGAELPSHLLEAVDRLAARARNQELVLFMGAGASAGAGLHTWGQLLDELAARAGVGEQHRPALRELDFRDRAAVLERALASRAKDLRQETAEILGGASTYSLVQGLLASLPVNEAVTTNFDSLYEMAARTGGRHLSVIPDEPEVTPRWLLKLHGSVTAPERIVLTRSDFLQVPRQYGALLGLVQALLFTKHMLFVGYSLKDEDFHELLHEVRVAKQLPVSVAGSAPYGTVLMLEDAPMLEHLWAGELDVVAMVRAEEELGDEARQVAVHRLEVFLDHLAAASSSAAPYFLDDAYKELLDDGEIALREQLRALQTELSSTTVHVDETVRTHLRAFLADLGVESRS
jgi:hypothetical protein